MSPSVCAAITSIGRFLPEDRLTNEQLSQMVDTTDEWIRTRTGISERRILRDKSKATSYMAIRAGAEALKKRGITADQVDVIIVATVTPDMFFPATACLVRPDLGLHGHGDLICPLRAADSCLPLIQRPL